MTVFYYDKTFEGLLSAVFEAFKERMTPDRLLQIGEPEPLFTEHSLTVVTVKEHASRVWSGLAKKVNEGVRNMLKYCWLSEISRSDELIFRYIYKIFSTDKRIEYNFGDADMLEVEKIARKVAGEALHIKQFVRFQKSSDGIFFAPVRPIYNALPLTVEHFTDRFKDQQWIIYDMNRDYGYYYDLQTVTEISLTAGDKLSDGKLDRSAMAKDEQLFQKLWKSYFKAIAIRERINPRKQRQDMPVRFWRDLTEKQ